MTTHRKTLLLTAVTLLAMAFTTAVQANDTHPCNGGTECRAEIQNVCGDRDSSDKKTHRACVEANFSSFSSTCQEWLTQKRAKRNNKRSQ